MCIDLEKRRRLWILWEFSQLTLPIAMIRILDKVSILRLIVPHLSVAKRGFVSRASLTDIVNAILYKFKSGCQWHLLPIKSLISRGSLKYGAIYHHFRKWTLDGSWKRVRRMLARYNPRALDLSLAHFDGTHTRANKGGKGVGYQRRKRSKTTNTLWLVDSNGLVVSYLPPVAGNHNDLYNIEAAWLAMIQDLKQMGIEVDGLFINADAGFDAEHLRHLCEDHDIHLNAPVNRRSAKADFEFDEWFFDRQMYEQRFVVERTNAWMDANRSMNIRYDTTIDSWIAWHDLYCILAWCRKIRKV